jgi:hypothetical protein
MLFPAIAPGNAPEKGVPTPRGCHSRFTPRGRHRLPAASASVVRCLELAALAEKVRQLQAAWRPPLQRCPTGLTKLDAALGGGFALGCVHELLAPADGAAARSLALWAAARAVDHPSDTCPTEAPRGLKPAARQYDFASEAPVATKRSQTPPSFPDQRPAKWVLYIDTSGDLYPPAAAQLGLSLERLLIIRTQRTADALWACEQVLRCKAVAAVVLPIRAVDSYVSRRLQLAAETGGGLGFLLRRETRGDHTFTATRLRLDPVPNKDPTPCSARDGAPACQQFGSRPIAAAASDDRSTTRRMRVTLLKVRDGRPAEPFELALPHTAARETIPRRALWAHPPQPPLQIRSPLSAASAS